MADRHGFSKYRHGFLPRVGIFPSENKIRVWHNSSSRAKGERPADFSRCPLPESRLKCPDFVRTGTVFGKTGMVSALHDDFTTKSDGREQISLGAGGIAGIWCRAPGSVVPDFFLSWTGILPGRKNGKYRYVYHDEMYFIPGMIRILGSNCGDETNDSFLPRKHFIKIFKGKSKSPSGTRGRLLGARPVKQDPVRDPL